MSKLATEFSKRDWKKCCGKGCGKCEIHRAYLDKYGKKQGEKRFSAGHEKRH